MLVKKRTKRQINSNGDNYVPVALNDLMGRPSGGYNLGPPIAGVATSGCGEPPYVPDATLVFRSFLSANSETGDYVYYQCPLSSGGGFAMTSCNSDGHWCCMPLCRPHSAGELSATRTFHFTPPPRSHFAKNEAPRQQNEFLPQEMMVTPIPMYHINQATGTKNKRAQSTFKTL